MCYIMADKKEDTKYVEPSFNPKDLEVSLSPEDIKILERKEFIIKNTDLWVFDALPLDMKQKAEFLRHLAEGDKGDTPF